MLGVRRVVKETPDEMTVTLTMKAIIDSMVETFKPHLLSRRIHTPVPDKVFLYKKKRGNDEEARRMLGRGYQNLFGMLL